jgi:hypothetical protein
MNKNKEWMSHVMTAGGLAVFIVLGLACASSPPKSESDEVTVPKTDLTGVTSYYVKESGNDKNSGVSVDKPLKSLRRAVIYAAKTSVKTVTVIGTITSPCDVIKDISSDEEILITGKTDAAGADAAVIKPGKASGLDVVGSLKIRLERITFTGKGRINATGGAVITLGRGAKVTGIGDYYYGGSVFVQTGSMLVMEEDAEISGNRGGFGGGVCAISKAQLIMKGNAVIKDNEAFVYEKDGKLQGGQGGGVYLQANASLVMQDNASISGNKNKRVKKNEDESGGLGGGVRVNGSSVTLQDNASIMNNTTDYLGGGINMIEGTLVMKGKSAIRGNRAEAGGGVGASGNSTLTMEDDSCIIDNSASDGGGMWLAETSTTMKGKSAIRENHAETGGGVMDTRSTLIMEDESCVINNSAKVLGGAMWLDGTTFTQNTGTVSGNTAREGNDVYVYTKSK